MSKTILNSFVKIRPRYYNSNGEWQPQSFSKRYEDIYITEDGKETILTVFQEIEDRETTLKGIISDTFATITTGFPYDTSWEDIVYSIENLNLLCKTNHLFVFNEQEQTFIAPISGVYKIECYGSKGANYIADSTTFSGGYGGKVTAYVNLKIKDVVKIITGNSSGYKDGGVGAITSGGGSTSVYINETLCMIAGGGGGAGYGYKGGHGGLEVGLLTVSEGESSEVSYSAGGGGGYKGGKSGYLIYHKHSGNSTSGGACYNAKYCGGSIVRHSEDIKETCWGSRSLSGLKSDGIHYTYRTCNKCGYTEKNTVDGYGFTSAGVCQQQIDTGEDRVWYSCNSCGTGYSNTGTCSKITGYTLSCGKTEETVDSYSASYGGSNYYDSEICKNIISTSGINSEDGKVRITLQK